MKVEVAARVGVWLLVGDGVRVAVKVEVMVGVSVALAVGTSEIFGAGFMRWLARKLRVVVLDPDANLIPAMRAGAFGLNHGRILVLYPEGERTNDGNLRIFRKGAAILSVHTRAPIVPIAIEGFYDVWPRHKKFPKFGRLEMTIGKPMIPPPETEASEATYERFTAELKARVSEMWEELRKDNHDRRPPV